MKRLRYLGVSSLRVLKAADFRALGDDLIVVTVHGHPAAAVVSYEAFIRMQNALKAASVGLASRQEGR